MSTKRIIPRFTPSQMDFLCQLKASDLPRKLIVDIFLREHPHYFEIASENGISEEELIKKIEKRVTSLGRSLRQSSQVIRDYRENRTLSGVERSLAILSHCVDIDIFDDLKGLLEGLRERSRIDDLHELDYLKGVKTYLSTWTSYHNSVYKRFKAERDIIKFESSEHGKGSTGSAEGGLEMEDKEDTSVVAKSIDPSKGKS